MRLQGEKPALSCPCPEAAPHITAPVSGAMPHFQGLGRGSAILPMLEGRGQMDILGSTPVYGSRSPRWCSKTVLFSSTAGSRCLRLYTFLLSYCHFSVALRESRDKQHLHNTPLKITKTFQPPPYACSYLSLIPPCLSSPLGMILLPKERLVGHETFQN